MSSPTLLREAPFALRVVQRRGGKAAIVYQRQPDRAGRDHLQRVAALSPLAFTAGQPLLRDGVLAFEPASAEEGHDVLTLGPFHALDAAWGTRTACFALVASGLRDARRLLRAAEHLRHANAADSAWWLGLLTQDDGQRALRALRILTEAVE